MAIHDGDILYLYDAKLTNPNGDPDDENRPRMDEATGRNLVSDVRLKRYLRDYWLDAGEDIWVRRTEQDETTSSKQRMSVLLSDYNRENGANLNERQARQSREFKDWLLRRLRDVRLFGATMPMENTSVTFTGPVQFSWGYSLHRVEINNSATISSHFAGRENEYGTFGKDWRVHYSLLAFYGIVSKSRARHTGLTDEDLTALDEAMVRAIPQQATTRSKIGQTPRLYLRVEYEDGSALRLGDVREDLALDPKDGKTTDTLRDIRDFTIGFDRVLERVRAVEDSIGKARLWSHPELGDAFERGLRERLGDRLETF
ncbi:hypothetical protein Rxycam_02327 [Rubrobacter xylanophilus DSM 9941]|uniref:type I-B CRISPR-associated protein Cas7/Csh2 n=1 Tax=Rubrobacter xylanophilus TaxID=49319 RepID=UPI001C63DAA6|nr:type I-B CRISPR-associated protein Cas7/Csh2 [Rubrobacter xylanophilus]QYJ16494.1 hypothetical protein Rxycam_02327 [Rubrobacter xylanophilus DSM 9941]